MATLTNDKIKVLMFNAVGRSGEVLQEPVFSLQIAGSYNRSTNRFMPVGESGYSLGIFQNDFGQRKNAQLLIDAYNAWASDAKNGQPLLTSNEQNTLLTDLNSTGSQIRQFTAQRYMLPSDPLRIKINDFLQTDTGHDFVATLDQAVLDTAPGFAGLEPFAQEVAQSQTVQALGQQDGEAVVAAVSKVFNQNHNYGNQILSQLQTGRLTLENVKSKIESLNNASIDSGVDNTLSGVDLLHQIENSPSLSPLWQAQLNSDPTLESNFSSTGSAKLFDAMFRNPVAGTKLLDAIADGRGGLITISSKAPDETNFAGVTTNGDIFVLNKYGSGQMQIGGQWV